MPIEGRDRVFASGVVVDIDMSDYRRMLRRRYRCSDRRAGETKGQCADGNRYAPLDFHVTTPVLGASTGPLWPALGTHRRCTRHQPLSGHINEVVHHSVRTRPPVSSTENCPRTPLSSWSRPTGIWYAARRGVHDRERLGHAQIATTARYLAPSPTQRTRSGILSA